MREWFTAQTLASMPGVPGSDRRVRSRAEKDGWKSRPREVGKGFEYHISSLPAETQAHIRREASKRSIEAINNEPEFAEEARLHELAQREAARQAAERARERKIRAGLQEYAALPADSRKKKRAKARLWVLRALGDYLQRHQCSHKAAFHGLAMELRDNTLTMPGWVRDEMPVYRGVRGVSEASIAKWFHDYRNEGVMALTDGYGNRKHQSCIETNADLFRLVIGALVKAPQITGKAMMEFLRACNKKRAESGDEPLSLPHQRSYERFRNAWIEQNRQVWTMMTNPDQWKNKFMLAAGSHSEHVERLNQLWELDSTPADWMLIDGRHSVVGVIDMYSRRLKYFVSKTSKSMAVCQVTRRAIMDWGVCDGVRTDNGQDYVSNQFEVVLQGLDIAHYICIPFASEEKGTIERAMRTLSHGILNLLPGFIGHNVAERKAIEARKSFAKRMMTQGEVIDVEMSAADLQQHLDNWCEHYYGNDKHSSLGMSPNEKARRYTGSIRRIDDERALDMLLSEVAGVRKIGKKGVRFENHTYFNDEMGAYVGKDAMLKYDERDIGRLYAYVEERFIGVLLCHDILGISRQEAAAAVKAKQKKLVAKQAAEYRAWGREIKENMAETVLDYRIAESENVVALPHQTETHRTTGLDEAGRALLADAGEQPESTPLTDAEQAVFDAMNADEPADNTPESLRLLGHDPVRDYRLWESLKARSDRGETLLPAEADFVRGYATTTEHDAMKKFIAAE